MDDKETFDRLQFLYLQRLSLFNTRRGHEWQIFFGVIGLLLALDAVQVANGLRLAGWLVLGWDFVVVGLSTCCLYYEWELQKRNSLDRMAMNSLYNRLCEASGIPVGSAIYESEERAKHKWAFWAQMGVLFITALLSAAVPLLKLKEALPCIAE